jgi:hypothetical protein
MEKRGIGVIPCKVQVMNSFIMLVKSKTFGFQQVYDYLVLRHLGVNGDMRKISWNETLPIKKKKLKNSKTQK